MEELNYWTDLSIQYANQWSYTGDLLQVYSVSKYNKDFDIETKYLFEKWINKKSLGILPTSFEKFMSNDENSILENKYNNYSKFCKNYLAFNSYDKLDLIARFNGKYVIGKAIVLTNIEEKQNKQLNDISDFLEVSTTRNFEKIVVLDNTSDCSTQKIYQELINKYANHNLISILVLTEFLYQI